MKIRSIFVLSLVALSAWLIVLLYSTWNATHAMQSILGTPEPESYLPLVFKQPTPTITPTPSPTPIPYGVHILDNHSSFAHYSHQGYSVVGEIYNNTGDYLWNIQVGAKFYDSQGKLVNTISHPLDFIYRLKPGKRTCFSLDEFYDGIDWDYYVFQPLGYFTDDLPPPLINTGGVTGSMIADRYFISGWVSNGHPAGIVNTRVQGTLYDEDDIVLDCRSGPVNIPDLGLGEYSFFELEFMNRGDGYGDVDDYRLERQADPYF